jgi:hypothetical protein
MVKKYFKKKYYYYIKIIKPLNRQDLNKKIIGREAFTSVNCAFILRKNLKFCAEAS